MRSLTAIVAIAISFGSAIGRAEVTFTESPRATRVGNSTKIEFAVCHPTDVAVRIDNAAGETVRHLVAGRLGDDPPAPLKPGALDQAIDWDGNDDAGRPAVGGPFTARVSIGLAPVFDKVIGWSGQHVDAVRGLTCGPDGTLYLVYGGQLYAHRQTTIISAFDRTGKYARQVFPGPANLPPEKRRGWPRAELDDGREVPVIFHLLPRTTYPGAVFDNRVFPVATRDGRLVILSGAGHTTNKYPDFRGGRRLLILGSDGSVPEDFLGPEICPLVGGFGHIALSPDDRYVYATGFVDTGRKGKGPCQVVYRAALDGSEPSRILIGKLYEAGAGKNGLNDPQGIAVDAGGNVYVADYGNHRIAVFEPGGKYLDEIPVDYPDGLHVSKKTGAIYVMQLKERQKPFDDQHYYVPAHNWRAHRVIKFDSLKTKTERASFENTLVSRYGGGAQFAVDESGEVPILWLTGLTYGGGPVLRIADRGDSFELLDSPLAGAGQGYRGEHLGFFGDVAIVGDQVIARHPAFGMHTNTSFVYSAETGEFLGTYVPKKDDGQPENMWSLLYGEMVAGRDGNLYVHARNNVIRRYDAEGGQLPFTATGTNFVEGFWHGHTRGAGMFIDTQGKIYIPAAAENRKLESMKVQVIGPDGKIVDDSLIEIHNARVGGIAVDRQGNIFLGAQVARRDERVPRRFAGRLPTDSDAGHPSNDYKQHAMLFKFPPQGGRIYQDADGEFVAHCQYQGDNVSVDGALWMRRLGYIGVHGHELGCHCETTRFDVDDYGRVFVPDVFRFCVYVLDAQGNEITRFGAFGNMDSRGPGSPVPEPAIPFGWPLSVELAGQRAFVADTVNRRVVAVRMAYQATEECPLP